ncbi:MAG: transglycosylase domain-containing protein [Bacteroidia bacterium]|nr:transglycosylase domain-containing protein [Bacteroidia bacterium]MCX7763536.1 transglycosylase domain-containing protein [Bacteroidia bacterium]MDW8057361.1 transglycosylase domain-containing protein [Bacteroidia bacterium]
MLGTPLRWIVREIVGLVVLFIIAVVGFLWLLKWIPFPPMGVIFGYFSGQAPQWGWVSAEEVPQALLKTMTHLIHRRSLRQRMPFSQQVAEQLFYPPNSPKWGSSLIGSLLSALWSEERLILFYLNAIPYDKGVYGIKAAAQRRYHKRVEELTPAEMADLILRREGIPLFAPLPAAFLREKHQIERLLSSADGSSSP